MSVYFTRKGKIEYSKRPGGKICKLFAVTVVKWFGHQRNLSRNVRLASHFLSVSGEFFFVCFFVVDNVKVSCTKRSQFIYAYMTIARF